MMASQFLPFLLLSFRCFAGDLTGNWAVKNPVSDGTVRASYFHLRHDGARITGTNRTGQFDFTISESRTLHHHRYLERWSARP
jgi:hypothetical protein